MPDIADSRLTIADLGRVLDLTPRRIRQLIDNGVLIRDDDGKLPLGESVRAFVTFKASDTAVDPQAAARLLTAKANKETSLAEKHDLEVRKLRGELAEVASFDLTLQALAANVRQRLIGIPTAAAPLVVGEESVVAVEATIRTLLYEALQELCGTTPADAAPKRATTRSKAK